MINRKKILIADSDALNLDFFDLMLSKLGFIVEKVQDGHIALEKITSGAASAPPDLIIINDVLPKVSGWEILKAVKADPKTAFIPVLLLSEIDDVKEIVEAFELGADDYIVKPFNFSVVLARIRAALRNNMLISQICTREKRLVLADQFSNSLKHGITDFQQVFEELLSDITAATEPDAGAAFNADHAVKIKDKAVRAQGMFSKIENMIEQTEAEWKSLKEKEIGLPILEKPIRDTVDY